MQLHKAKKEYYSNGNSKMTDADYDRLESSFILLHSRKRYDLYVGVGYTENAYEKYKSKFEQINTRV